MALYKKDLVPTIFSHKLWAPQWGWTQQCTTALDWFCKCYFHVAATEEWGKEQMAIQNLREICAKPHSQKAPRCRAQSPHGKKDADGEVLDAMMETAPAQDRRHAVLMAMVVLYWVVAAAVGAGQTTAEQLSIANACLILIIYLNGFAGRSMEWTLMKRDGVLKRFAKHPGRISSKKRKTVDTYGPLAKCIFPVTL